MHTGLLYCYYYETGELETESESTGSAWRNEILHNLDVLPKLGYPGRIVVYGKHAEPILTGVNDVDVLVAAAEFGQGRIVVIAQNDNASIILESDQSTVKALSKFHANIKQWLTRGTYEEQDSIISAKDKVSKEKLMSSKIVIFDGDIGEISLRDITEYVRSGGALFYCFTPIGWLQSNKGKTLFDAPYMNLLAEVGICFTDENSDVPEKGFSVNENEADDAHLLRVMEGIRIKLIKPVERPNMLLSIKHLPNGILLKLKSIVEIILENCGENIERAISFNMINPPIYHLWLLCYDILQPPNIKAPLLKWTIPYDFDEQPPLTSHTIAFHSDREDFHSTACYLPPGQTLKVNVISGNEGLDWELRIGCHTDDLRNQNKLQRWPVVHKKVKLTQKGLDVSTPFGGLIYLISPSKESQHISVKLENVVDSPSFRLTEGENGKEAWELSRRYPGLWTDIEGEFITITLPASSVREMEFDALRSVMQTWDSVVRLYHNLRGTDVSKSRRMWIVTDRQPVRGYMHAGYPIVTGMDVAFPKTDYFLLNGSVLQKVGSWGVFHEIGHMFQKEEWTFTGTGEVTGNVFVLYAMETICHLKPWIHKWLQDQLTGTEKFLKDGADFQKWKESPGIGLMVYAQLAHEFGWESYRKVFRRYEAMSESETPKDDQMKIDTWFSIFSETAGCNLTPLASFWGIPLSSEAIARLHATLQRGFLPDDKITRFAPDRVDHVLLMFPGTVREKCSAE